MFPSNVLKAHDARSVPNDRARSWQPRGLPALPVGTGVPCGCELEGWFQAGSACSGDRRAPRRDSAWRGVGLSLLLLTGARTALLPVPEVADRGPFAVT